jgi:hypothetical protein
VSSKPNHLVEFVLFCEIVQETASVEANRTVHFLKATGFGFVVDCVFKVPSAIHHNSVS